MRVLLVEPSHPKDWGNYNQYHGLLKIGAYHKAKGDDVQYVVGPGGFDVGDVIYVASIFSYWEPYYLDTLRYYRGVAPKARIVFGGIHAINAYDRVMQWADELHIEIMPRFDEAKDCIPDVTLIGGEFASLMTSRGCPNRCAYCSSWRVYGAGWQPRERLAVVEEIAVQVSRGIRIFGLYDDNFLFQAEHHAMPLLEEIIRLQEQPGFDHLTFAIPSGFQAGHMTPEIASLLWRANFKGRMATGLESLNPEVLKRMGRAAWSDLSDLPHCAEYMEKAGYKRRDLSVFFMCGLPYQTITSMLETAIFIGSLGCYANMQRFAPIPGTLDFARCGLDVMTMDMVLTEGDRFVASGALFTDQDLRDIATYVRWQNCAYIYSGVNMFDPPGGPVAKGIRMAAQKIVRAID